MSWTETLGGARAMNDVETRFGARAPRGFRGVGFFALLGLLLPFVASADTGDPISPRPTMRLVFEEMKELIPLSLDEATWSDPASRAEIMASLDRLANAAGALESHGRAREAGFDELALNLSRDIYDARERYRLQEFEESRFFLTASLQNCVGCHMRLPSNVSFPLADELTTKEKVEALEPSEKAFLYVVVRRFDDALDVWERALSDPGIAASELDAGGVLSDYLNVAIRVRGDTKRVAKTLERFAARDDLPVYLERRIGEWREGLEGLDPKLFDGKTEPSMERGVALAKQAGEIDQGPYGRDGLIQDLAAASQLVRWLERDRVRATTEIRNRTKKEREDAALAYYWLGIVEARSLDGFWVNLAERHMEAAVRADPKGPLALKAYSLLEETQALGYGGSSGAHLPSDVWNLLRELREMMGLDEG